MIKKMKIKVIKLSVGGCNSEIVWFDEEFICDESEFSFKMKDKNDDWNDKEWDEWMKLNCEGLKFEVDGKI